MDTLLPFLARRLAIILPQVFGVTVVTFVLIRLLPGDPAFSIAGPAASDETIAAVRERLGLDQPIVEQYVTYVRNLLSGDLGDSWFTGNSVVDDLTARLPATLELISASLLVIIATMVPLGALSSRLKRRSSRGATSGYATLAGAIPDFWLALMLVYVFYYLLGIAPPPEGRIAPDVIPPDGPTGSYVLDSIVAGNWSALGSAVAHLALPVATLAVVYGAFVLKMTRSSVTAASRMPCILLAYSKGLPERRILFTHALRPSLKTIITTLGVTYGYLLGGAVLVETVFSLGGIGQYAVQGIVNADFAVVQGFVLIAALFSITVYLVVELLYFVVDPRVR